MARLRAIILDQPEEDTYHVALWADVPSGLEAFYADVNKTSQWRHAVADDITALQAGTVVEHVMTIKVPKAWDLATAQAEIQKRWQIFSNKVIIDAKIWLNTNTVWDGQIWKVED